LTSLPALLDNPPMIPSLTAPLVLVADDEPTMLELVARHLKSMENPRVDVIEASDGEQAWRMAREHLPDLVVLDVMMPGMSGWEVCRKIREDVALAHTGVVMLTGIGENLNQMTSPLYGADAYVDKPFEFGELDEKVKNALEARASQREGMQRPSVNGVTGPAEGVTAKKKAKAAASPAPAKKAKPAKKVAVAAKKVAAAPKKKAAKARPKAKAKAKAPAKKAKKAKKKPARPVARKKAKRSPAKVAKRAGARKTKKKKR
jgi:DNA-binding response OmpR family regulator